MSPSEGAPFELSRDAFGRLVLSRAEGPPIVGVLPIRAFPLTAPEEWISLVDGDGREVEWVRNLRQLPAPIAAIIEEELAQREFVPLIEEIYSISKGADPSEWFVRTDRGELTFILPAAENLRPLGDHGVLVSDMHGIRYRILDRRRLPRASNRLLLRYM